MSKLKKQLDAERETNGRIFNRVLLKWSTTRINITSVEKPFMQQGVFLSSSAFVVVNQVLVRSSLSSSTASKRCRRFRRIGQRLDYQWQPSSNFSTASRGTQDPAPGHGNPTSESTIHYLRPASTQLTSGAFGHVNFASVSTSDVD